MKNNPFKFFVLLLLLNTGCKSDKQSATANADKTFAAFENSFLDAYWKQYPSASIFVGYGKYYDKLVIPDSSAFAANISFSNYWIDSLSKLDQKQLNENNKISFSIIKNQLQSDLWYTSVFKPQEWDASVYNISGPCDYIISQPYALLDERLKILTRYLQRTEEYYKAAFSNLRRPTREHVELSMLQNQAGISVFGTALADAINASHLATMEKDSLHKVVNNTVRAMNDFVSKL